MNLSENPIQNPCTGFPNLYSINFFSAPRAVDKGGRRLSSSLKILRVKIVKAPWNQTKKHNINIPREYVVIHGISFLIRTRHDPGIIIGSGSIFLIFLYLFTKDLNGYFLRIRPGSGFFSSRCSNPDEVHLNPDSKLRT